jgi:hypothetical protein
LNNGVTIVAKVFRNTSVINSSSATTRLLMDVRPVTCCLSLAIN